MHTLKLLALPLLLAACSASAPASSADAKDAEEATIDLLTGRYKIVAINGVAPIGDGTESEEWQRLQFSFGERSYGGDAGCNALGGLYVQVGNRIYTMVGPQTAMGCSGARKTQENAAHGIFYASPEISRSGENIVLTGGGHEMTLGLVDGKPPEDPPEAWQSPRLAGQDYLVEAVMNDRIPGQMLWSDAPPSLSFGADRVSLRVDCPASVTAVFTEGEGVLEVDDFSEPCAKGERDRALARLVEGEAKFVSGPNGELLIASERGWATLQHRRRDRPK